jgi:hypothetical protein
VKSEEARELGLHLAVLIGAGQIEAAYALLESALTSRTPFRLLDQIGETLGVDQKKAVNAFLDHIASFRTMGGWPVIASALRQQLAYDLSGALARCRQYVITADVWYGTDILGERVPGAALVDRFDQALPALVPWRDDPNHWVRRTVGVAVHLWAKRARGSLERAPRAKELLAFLAPMFEERDIEAVKGVGWGLKTLGRYYPDLVANWLPLQIRRPHRALMLRKALTYLPASQRERVTGSRP